jgi:hypothetical protein
MPDIPYKKDVPDYRTIVPGVWSDLLNDASVTFDSNNDAVRVNIKNLDELKLILVNAFLATNDQNNQIIEQLRLLNIRFEEAYATKIKECDV